MRIALAYSGGLDTSVIVRWLIERYNAEIITVTGNLGQKKELIGVEEKARASGALRSYMVDLAGEFASDYVVPALRAGALYEGVYPMATALGRPLLAKSLVEIARAEGCDAVAHGCTGKGNDQVRFEASVAALAPELRVLAPVREWEFRSREEELEYCHKHGIPVTATVASPYSIDENLWGTSIECGALEDPRTPPPADVWQRTVDPRQAPDAPAVVQLEFVEGVPVALDGRELPLVELIDALNTLAGAHGVGRIDLVENRLVGIKSREVYEAPAATVLHRAHTELERLVLDRDTAHYKAKLAHDYADLVYNGLWFAPLRRALDGFIAETQRTVTGGVILQLYRGNVTTLERWSSHSLYDTGLATYTAEDQFDHRAAAGFIALHSLPLKTWHRVNGGSVERVETSLHPSNA